MENQTFLNKHMVWEEYLLNMMKIKNYEFFEGYTNPIGKEIFKM